MSLELEKNNAVFAQIKGSDLIGHDYKPMFDFFKNQSENAFKVLDADFVSTEDGTGIVHMAPGFGEEDYDVCQKHNINPALPVNENGLFFNLPDIHYNNGSTLALNGKQVFEAESEIIQYLKSIGTIVSIDSYKHNYPFCWRTDTPLIYKLVDSWYLKVTNIKDRMLILNQEINWIPNHIKNGAFGKWLENTRDWSISRNRFWGCPIPIWVSNDSKYPNEEVFGSIKEIVDTFGDYYFSTNGKKLEINNLHKEFLDTITRPNPKDPTGKSMMVRVPEVFDCWFESGAMPYAQIHYPFEFKDRNGNVIRSPEENQKWFNEHFPADFVCEYLAQTRGWFYTMMVLSVAMFDNIPFKNCICHGVMLDEKGNKLSKKLQNYPDLMHILNIHGADALRFSMLRSPVINGNEFYIDVKGEEVGKIARSSLKDIWNAFSFLNIHLQNNGLDSNHEKENLFSKFPSSNYLMDKYILSKLSKLVEDVEKNMDEYNSMSACLNIEEFLKILNNWYIRRSKARFLGKISTCNKNQISKFYNICKYGNNEVDSDSIQGDKLDRALFLLENEQNCFDISDEDTDLIAQYLIQTNQKHRIHFQCDDNGILQEMRLMSNSKLQAISTLYFVLYNFTKTSASLLPFLTEKIFKKIVDIS